MTQREIDEITAPMIEAGARMNPPEVDYSAPLFERHELIAMAACLAIGGVFAVAAHFLPMLADWIVG